MLTVSFTLEYVAYVNSILTDKCTYQKLYSTHSAVFAFLYLHSQISSIFINAFNCQYSSFISFLHRTSTPLTTCATWPWAKCCLHTCSSPTLTSCQWPGCMTTPRKQSECLTLETHERSVKSHTLCVTGGGGSHFGMVGLHKKLYKSD